MGYRNDDLLDDEQADQAFRRLLFDDNAPALIEPPPDLVTRSLRRLPPVPPAVAAQIAARRRRFQRALLAAGGTLLGLIALLSLWNIFGSGPHLAGLFGDGNSGVSRALLVIALLAKPILRTIGSVDPPFLLGGALIALISGLLWWWLFRQTPVYIPVETRP